MCAFSILDHELLVLVYSYFFIECIRDVDVVHCLLLTSLFFLMYDYYHECIM